MKRKIFSVLLALVLVLSFSLVTAVPVAAADLSVPSPYATIQAAIDAASSGDTIIVSDGTYTEDLTVNTANLTLKSLNGKAVTTIQLVDGVGIDIQAGATNFTLGGASGQGFTISPNATATTFNIQLANAPSGVEISYNEIDTTGNASMGISVGAAGASGLTVSNNTFTAEAGDGSIWGPKVVNVTVSANTFTGPGSTTSGYAVEFAGVTGTSAISGNTISGYGMGVAIFHGEGTSGLTISGNTISGCENGIRLGQYSPTIDGDMTTVTVTQNTLSTNTIALRISSGANVKASQFTVNNNNISGSTTFGLQNQSSETVTAEDNWWSDASGPTHSSNPLGTGDDVSDNVDFMPWLDAAYPGGQPVGLVLNITQSTSHATIQEAIDAATAGDTIVAKDAIYTEDITVNTANLTLRSLNGKAVTTITTTTKPGIEIQGTATNFVLGGASGEGFTIDGTAAHLIVLANNPSGVVIAYNTIDTTDAAVTRGISVGVAGATYLAVSNNTFTGNTGDGSLSAWDGPTSDVTVSSNTFENGAYAIQFSGVTGTSTISGNTVTGYDGAGAIVITNGTGTSGLTISDNEVTDCSYGVRFEEECIYGTADNMTTVTVTQNTITDSTNDAIKVGDGTHVLASNFTITNNNISGSTSYGLNNQHTTESVTAENNWWGDASGPSEEGTGTGDAVSTNVDFTPWLDAEYPTGQPSYPVYNSTTGTPYDSIQDAVDAASTGDVITVGPGEYTLDITINEDITLVSSGGSEVTKITGTGGTDPVITIGDYTVTLEGFEIDPGDYGVYIYDISAGNVVTIEDSVIHGNTYQGIWVEGTVYGTLNILNNIIADNGYEGICINEVDDGGIVVIQGNKIGAWEDADYTLAGNGYEGIYIDYIYDGSTVTIGGDEAVEANIICDNGEEGIYVNELYYGSTLTIEGNTIGAYAYDGYTFYGNYYENIYVYYVDYGSTLTIRDNVISDAQDEEGIEIYQVGFDGSSFTADEYYALYQTYGANYVTIEGNTITGNYYAGLYISYVDFASYITIEDNVVSRNLEEGIVLEYFGQTNGYDYYLDDDTASVHQDPDYPDYFGPVVLVKGNTITDNEDDGIYQYDDWEYGTSVTIEDNVITGNLDAGIYHSYDVMNDAHVLIKGNTIASNGFDGWYGGIYMSSNYIDYASSYTVENNLIAGNWGDGIYIYGVEDSSSLTIRGNTVGAGTDAQGSQYPGNDGYGIEVEYVDYDSTAEISRNTISGNSSYGIYIYEVYEYSSVNITRNIITENSEGIYIDYVYDDGSVSITRNDILDNDSYGIDIYDVYYDGSLDAHYNNIAGNPSYGVYYSYNSMDEYVDASNNWWGDDSGPYHSSYNPDGLGDEVSDYVYFSPWLTSPGVRVALAEGWNTFATPIALDTASNELAKLGLDMNIAYGFSGGVWTQIIPANDGLEPCEAFYIKMNSRDIFDLTPSDTYSDPPSRALSAGWNLVSLANLSDMAAEDGLASAYLVSGDYTGYSQVVSPAVNQAAWSAVRGPAIDTALGYDLLPCEGYWVFMNNAGTLAGFTSTPVLGP